MTLAIHRMNLKGKPNCGVSIGKVSSSGVGVTCPNCIKLQTPNREAQLASLLAAAERSRQNR